MHFHRMMYFRIMKLETLHPFEINTKEQWQRAISKELGEKSLESLQWKPIDGLTIEPYYTESKHTSHPIPKTQPFLIHQSIRFQSPTSTRAQALQCLEGGAQSLTFANVPSWSMMIELLQEITWPYIQIQWQVHEDFSASIVSFNALMIERQWNSKEISGCLGLPIEDAIAGRWSVDLLRQWQTIAPRMRLFNVDISTFGYLSADLQIAAALCQIQEALHQMVGAGLTVDEASAMFQVSVALDTSYFLEIAKLQVMRQLYQEVIAAYRPQYNCSSSLHVHVQVGLPYEALETNTNLLRATTCAMSAALGGATSIDIKSHRQDLPNEDTYRLSRNILHLMREESYFDQAYEATTGSYYLEEIMHQLRVKAWNNFLESEEKGGWNIIERDFRDQSEVAQVQYKQKIEQGVNIRVGVNKYQVK
jgi:methylmalonyl-CoA mutase